MKLIFTSVILLLHAVSFAQNPGKLLHYGGTQNDLAYASCKGNGTQFFTTGYFSGTATMGSTVLVSSGSEDLYIAKYDSAGQVIWARKAGGTGSDMGFSISYNAGYVYVTGVFSGTANFGATSLTSSGGTDGFIAKYNDNGDLIWAKKAGASAGPDRTDEIAFEGGNTMYLCGSFADGAIYNGVSLLTSGGVEAYILKLDTAGNLLKHTNIGGIGNDFVYDLKLNNGGIYISGNFASGVIDFGPAIAKSNAGGYDAFVAKYDTALTAVWANTGGGNSTDDFERLIVDSSGNCYATGYFTDFAFFNDSSISAIISGNNDGFIAKYDSVGALSWIKRIGAHSGGQGREIKFGNTQSEVVVFGHFSIQLDNHSQSDTSKGLTDGFMLTFDPNGNTTSYYTFGGAGVETICEVVQIANKTWLTGGMDGVSLFNSISVTSNGGQDVSLWEFVSPLPTTGIAEKNIENTAFMLYPNPAADLFTVKGENMIYSVDVYNLIGEKVYSVHPNAKQITIDAALSQGLYFVVMNGDRKNAQKVLIHQ